MDHFAAAVDEAQKKLRKVQEMFASTHAWATEAIARGDFSEVCPPDPTQCKGSLCVSRLGVLPCPADPCPHEAIRRQARYCRFLSKIGLGGVFVDSIMDEVPADARPVIEAYCDTLHDRIAEGDGLILAGPPGRGKTSIMALIAMTASDCDPLPYVVFSDATALFDELKQRVSKDRDSEAPRTAAMSSASVADLWMLDDLGTEDRQWAWDAFRQIIDYRWRRKKATVVSTNLTAADLDADPMMAREKSRLMERCVWVTLTGPSKRRVATADHWLQKTNQGGE